MAIQEPHAGLKLRFAKAQPCGGERRARDAGGYARAEESQRPSAGDRGYVHAAELGRFQAPRLVRASARAR
jgi:hypothetical protein